jgi:hypothetical protein
MSCKNSFQIKRFWLGRWTKDLQVLRLVDIGLKAHPNTIRFNEHDIFQGPSAEVQ